jgi:hypothetical protein
MTFRTRLITLVFTLFSLCGFAKTHILKKGETLASVAREYYGEPVWGPKGNINRIYKLNPWAVNSPNIVEPGQSIIIDDDSASAVPAPIVKTEPEKEAVILPPIEEMKKDPHPSTATNKPEQELILESTPIPAPEVLPKADLVSEPAPPATPAPALEPVPTTASAPPPPASIDRPKSYWIIAPSITSSKISVSTDPTTTSYDLNSTSTYGVTLGWDHWWTRSFSTLLSYSTDQLKSTAANDTTGSSFADAVSTSSCELALLNRFRGSTRLGLGVAYGTHLFIEGFAATPADQSIYKTTFWNPFLMAEVKLFGLPSMDFLLNLKMAPLPADVGHDHDLKSGNEYVVKFSVLKKLGNSAFSVGVSYLQNDQSRMATIQTRKDTKLEFGFLF